MAQRGRPLSLGSCIAELTTELISLQSQSARIEIEKTRVTRQIATYAEQFAGGQGRIAG